MTGHGGVREGRGGHVDTTAAQDLRTDTVWRSRLPHVASNASDGACPRADAASVRTGFHAPPS